jgi:N,N'-diacetyllegionaminate synthase
LRTGGPLTVLQCTSAYPCPPERVGINVIGEMKTRWKLPVGFSDHTLGSAASFAAVTLGASVVEKHFTFSRLMYGSDAINSMEPGEFSAFCQGLRDIATMLAAPVDKNDLGEYGDMKRIFQKSIVTAAAIPAGAVVTRAMLAFKKPGDGIPAGDYERVVGRKTARALDADHMLQESDFA